MKADKIRGCIYGQAIGDALGLGTEFMTRSEVKKHYPSGLKEYYQIIMDYHRGRFVRGRWTDDTDMSICILKGLKSNSEIDVDRVAENFKMWADGTPVGIGRHTYEVLSLQDYLEDPFEVARIIWRLSGRKSAGNGGVMRTSAVGLLRENVLDYSEKICCLTHPDPRCIASCHLISQIISDLIWKGTQMDYRQMLEFQKYDDEIVKYIQLANDSVDIEDMELDDTPVVGYTYKTLSAALWCLFHCNSFEEALLKVVNAGGDADTNAAVACSVLGAKYGYSSIPQRYIEGLFMRDKFGQFVENIVMTLLG